MFKTPRAIAAATVTARGLSTHTLATRRLAARRLAACIVGASILAACATDDVSGSAKSSSAKEPASAADGAADFKSDPRLGDRLGRVCWADRAHSKAVVSDTAVVFFRGDDAFLAEVSTCPTLLENSPQIALGMESTCITRGDYLLVSERMAMARAGSNRPARLRCAVRGLYEWTPTATPAE